MRDILDEADDLKTRMKEEGRWPPKASKEQEVVNAIMAKCPDNPSRELIAAMLSQAFCEGKVVAAGEAQAAIHEIFREPKLPVPGYGEKILR